MLASLTVLTTIGITAFGLNPILILESLASGFTFSGFMSDSEYARHQQFFALLNGWTNAPLLGAGLGAAAEGSIRSIEQPWAYELSYLALLYHTGVLGIAIYGSAVLWIFLSGLRSVRTDPRSAAVLLPVLTGAFCFLIANATNPYLTKFDYLWILFLPVGVLNAHLLKRDGGPAGIGMPVQVGMPSKSAKQRNRPTPEPRDRLR